MRFVIMADGKGVRWNNYMGIPKHLVHINGEPIIAHTVRLLRNLVNEEDEIIITSHDERYEFEGCRRHEPLNNNLEIDRFTEELITDEMCFLYGDTYYTEETLRTVLETAAEDVLFFGNNKSIVAIKFHEGEFFRNHVNRVRGAYLSGELSNCKGWQVYQSVTGQDFSEAINKEKKFIAVDENTKDINTPQEYEVMEK